MVPFIVVGVSEDDVEDMRDGIHCRSIGVVGKLKCVNIFRDEEQLKF